MFNDSVVHLKVNNFDPLQELKPKEFASTNLKKGI